MAQILACKFRRVRSKSCVERNVPTEECDEGSTRTNPGFVQGRRVIALANKERKNVVVHSQGRGRRRSFIRERGARRKNHRCRRRHHRDQEMVRRWGPLSHPSAGIQHHHYLCRRKRLLLHIQSPRIRRRPKEEGKEAELPQDRKRVRVFGCYYERRASTLQW